MTTTLQGVWLFLCRLSSFLYLRLSGYKTWSNIYRAIWEREFRDIPLRVFGDLPTLEALLQKNALKWRADSWKQLFDAVSYPAKAQLVFEGTYAPDSGFDCDDFACFTTNVLEKSLVLAKFPVSAPRFFTVMWLKGWKAAGHNVTLVTLEDGSFAYLDYGAVTGVATTPEGVAANVMNRYASEGARRIGWAISKGDLTPLEVHWG